MLKSHLPPKDLLEATHEFPCKYTFKVIGESKERFVLNAVAAVRSGLDIDFDPPYDTRESSGGRHISLTFEPIANSSSQVLSVYSELQKTEGVILLL